MNRVQYVKLKKFISDAIGVLSEVPQGSHFGPTLFVIFINDVCSVFDVEFLLVADDLKLHKSLPTIDDTAE